MEKLGDTNIEKDSIRRSLSNTTYALTNRWLMQPVRFHSMPSSGVSRQIKMFTTTLAIFVKRFWIHNHVNM
jgi:hypothetical protein